ncbi:hypothetical protein FKM82_013020 [Ascaphus truei]
MSSITDQSLLPLVLSLPPSRSCNMRLEIEAAVTFLMKVLNRKKSLEPARAEALGVSLTLLLSHRYQGHWYPDKPDRGQAYRCIRINPWQYVDESLLQACVQSGIEYSRLPLPQELTVWIDPFEVCGRLGENNDFFTIATFKYEVEVPVPMPKHPARETSDYSSEGPSSEYVSETSSDDEITGKKCNISEDQSPLLSSGDTIDALQWPQNTSTVCPTNGAPDDQAKVGHDVTLNVYSVLQPNNEGDTCQSKGDPKASMFLPSDPQVSLLEGMHCLETLANIIVGETGPHL